MINESFELKLDEYVVFVDPKKYDLTDLDDAVRKVVTVNPADYFITSGDAIQKTIVLERDLWAAAGKARSLYSKSRNKRHRAFQTDLWRSAGKCRVLLNKLKQVRGGHTFLETEWSNHSLYVLPKDPRSKKDVE